MSLQKDVVAIHDLTIIMLFVTKASADAVDLFHFRFHWVLMNCVGVAHDSVDSNWGQSCHLRHVPSEQQSH